MEEAMASFRQAKLYVVEQSSENVNFAEEKQKNSLL